MATPATVDEVPEEDFDAVNAEAEEDTAEESPNVSEYSTEDDEEVSVPDARASHLPCLLCVCSHCRSVGPLTADTIAPPVERLLAKMHALSALHHNMHAHPLTHTAVPTLVVIRCTGCPRHFGGGQGHRKAGAAAPQGAGAPQAGAPGADAVPAERLERGRRGSCH